MTPPHDHGQPPASGPKDLHQAPEGSVLKLERRPSAPEPPAGPEVTEESGAQALSDALRSSFVIVKGIMVILVAVFFGSGIFTVPSQEKALILRFGRPVGAGETQLLEPGLHWSFPYPIDEVVRIEMGQKSVQSRVGWFGSNTEWEALGKDPPEAGSLNPAADNYTITADANIVHVRAVVNYRITDPLRYALHFVRGSNVVQNALDSALVWASARTKVDDALRLDRLGFQDRVLTRARQLVAAQGIGITIDQGTVQAVAPRQVREQFEAVNSADAERRKAIEDATGQANRTSSAALGEAASLVNLGEVDRTRLTERVRAEADYFLAQLPHFENNPELFRTRVQTETMHRILTNVQDKIFWGKDAQLRIQLSREPQKPAATANP